MKSKKNHSSLNGIYTLTNLPEVKESESKNDSDSDWIGDLYVGTGLINGEPWVSDTGSIAFRGHTFEISREEWEALEVECKLTDMFEAVRIADNYYRKRATVKENHFFILRRWLRNGEVHAMAEAKRQAGYGVDWW